MIEQLQLAAEPEPLPSMPRPRGGSVLKRAAAFEMQAKGKGFKKRHAACVLGFLLRPFLQLLSSFSGPKPNQVLTKTKLRSRALKNPPAATMLHPVCHW